MNEDNDACCAPSTGCVPPPVAEATPSVAAFDDDEYARLAKALGHPARVAIMRILIERDTCICGEIVEELPLAQSTVSQHLKKLKAAGLIRGEVDGPKVCYCVDPAALTRFKSLTQLLG